MMRLQEISKALPKWTTIGWGCPFASRHATFVRKSLFSTHAGGSLQVPPFPFRYP